MYTIGERIVFLREERNISQKHLAACIDVTPATLSRYEKNTYEPKGETLSNMARELRTTTDFILGLSDYYDLPDNTPPHSNHLTAKEHLLLDYYRRLNHDNQIRLQERAQSLFENQK